MDTIGMPKSSVNILLWGKIFEGAKIALPNVTFLKVTFYFTPVCNNGGVKRQLPIKSQGLKFQNPKQGEIKMHTNSRLYGVIKMALGFV